MQPFDKTLLLLLLGLGLGLTGCGGSEHPLVPVFGTVTFDGGPCPAPGMLSFQPQTDVDGTPRRPGRAEFEKSGTFRATTFEKGDGLLPGKYLVKVRCDDGQPNPKSADPFGEITFIAKDYKPEELIVEAGAPGIELNIDVPLREK